MRAEASLGAAREELEPLPARVAHVEAELGDAKQVCPPRSAGSSTDASGKAQGTKEGGRE